MSLAPGCPDGERLGYGARIMALDDAHMRSEQQIDSRQHSYAASARKKRAIMDNSFVTHVDHANEAKATDSHTCTIPLGRCSSETAFCGT